MNSMFAFLGGLGATEMILIVFIIVLMFGARKLPDLARGIGQSIKEFKKGVRDEPAQAPKSQTTLEK